MMTRRHSRMTLGRRLIDLAFAMLLVISVSRAAVAQLVAERTFDRELAVWFGTLSVVGVPVAGQDFVRFSDRTSFGLASRIGASGPSVDARVRSSVVPVIGSPWVVPMLTNIEWVIGSPIPPDNFPAQQNLWDAFVATALALQAYWGSGTLTMTSMSGSARAYLLDSFVTDETGPVVAGDTDAPFTVGAPGQRVDVTHNFVANVQYFEQNAVWTLRSQITTPEPGTLSLLGVGLVMALIVARRRASAGVPANHRSSTRASRVGHD